MKETSFTCSLVINWIQKVACSFTMFERPCLWHRRLFAWTRLTPEEDNPLVMGALVVAPTRDTYSQANLRHVARSACGLRPRSIALEAGQATHWSISNLYLDTSYCINSKLYTMSALSLVVYFIASCIFRWSCGQLGNHCTGIVPFVYFTGNSFKFLCFRPVPENSFFLAKYSFKFLYLFMKIYKIL